MWFELFLQTRSYTDQEVAFIEKYLPNPPYRRVLDLCCGEGRHANILSQKNYEMIGVDIDQEALAIAAKSGRSSTIYLQQDIRELEQVSGQFDGIMSLWQSFGYFDEDTNQDILRQISRKLSDRGRFILDVYNRKYWKKHQGKRQYEKKSISIRAENIMIGNRLRSSLEYGIGLGSDLFEWQLYTVEELIALGEAFNLRLSLACTEYNKSEPISDEKPMMQLVFEKNSTFA